MAYYDGGVNIDWDQVYPPVRSRLQAKPRYVIAASGCWEWQGESLRGYGLCDPKHYGVEDGWIKANGQRRALAHRVSYIQNVGHIPEGLVVRHKCDNPPCVNPDHLELGTRADNQRDMQERNRGRGPALTCKRGHDLTDERNVRWCKADLKGGKRRRCKVCELERGERKTL